MKLNRRSVLGAIGLVGVGTGAAFGSGAFTSTTANRAVEVNVFGADLGTDGDGLADTSGDRDAEDNLASAITSEFADVLVNTAEATVDVRGGSSDSIIRSPGNLFPSFENSNVSTSGGNYSDFDQNYVSLVANDVTVVFGADNDDDGQGNLPQNSTVEYNPLFGFTTDANVGVSFGNAGIGEEGEGEPIITNVGGTTGLSGDTIFSGDGSSNESETQFGKINTRTSPRTTQDLDIVITDQS